MTAADWMKIVRVHELKKIRPEDIDRKDQLWVKQWDEHWANVDNRWRSEWLMVEADLVIASLRALLELLRMIVPTVTVRNGT